MDPLSTSTLFAEFLAQRRYLKNVTPSTIEWYETAFKALQRTFDNPSPPFTRSSLQRFVVDLRERGVKPISCNTYLKALKAFAVWLRAEGHLTEVVEVSLLRTEKRLLVTLTDAHIRALMSGKPKRFDQWRLHTIICLLLDTGVRIEEALRLRRGDVDFDNLLVTVFGKGRKERRIPFSFELRKVLFRFDGFRLRQCPRCDLLFPSRQGTSWNQRNSLRGLHLRQQKLGLSTFGWHRLRHTFATNYLRQGGDIVRLSTVLGHTQITTTQRYLHLLTEDLSASHQRVSILNRLG
jgi:integrase/recombinase XerD